MEAEIVGLGGIESGWGKAEGGGQYFEPRDARPGALLPQQTGSAF